MTTMRHAGWFSWILLGSFTQAATLDCIRKNNTQLPPLLSQTCLYSNFKKRETAPEIRGYRPNFVLWSDGAEKQRWVFLPSGEKINSDKAGDWDFPENTVFWKEFSIRGRRVETRILQRTSVRGKSPWLWGTYKWRKDGSDADLIFWAESNVLGTDHDIPSHQQCTTCHGNNLQDEDGKFRPFLNIRGFSALQLSDQAAVYDEDCLEQAGSHESYPGASALTLQSLILEQRLTNTHDWTITPPRLSGTALEQAAAGYLHVNCGSCHALQKASVDWLGMDLHQEPNSSANVWETPPYRTAVNVPAFYYLYQQFNRIQPGDLERSIVWQRMSSLVHGERMPLIASKKLDPYGLCVIKKWILSMSAKAPQ